MPQIRTADGVFLNEGSEAYNYYDMKPGRIGRIDSRPQPDTMKGQNCNTPLELWTNYWFDFIHHDGTRTTLDGSRICTTKYATKKGWYPL